jgi:ribosome-associated toxin RatA of RatAB toxin-antitoxin module
MSSAREPVHRSHLITPATPRELYDIVVDFPAYPRLFPELKGARVLSTQAPVVRVEFSAQMVLAVRYVLDLTCQPDVPSVDWRFVEGEIVADSTGSWRFTPEGAGTRVDYRVSMDVRAPVPGIILRKITDGLVSASLPRMFTSLEDEVRRRRAQRSASPPAG